MSIGLRIKELREEKNVKQSTLAEAAGVSTRQIQRWEKEEAYPPIDVFLKISDFFDVDVTFLSGRDNASKKEVKEQLLLQLTSIKKILIDQVDHSHNTIKKLVDSSDDLGNELRREVKQHLDTIRELLDLQDRTSDERMAEATNSKEYINKIIELDLEIKNLQAEFMSLAF